MASGATRLRAYLNEGRLVWAPGAWDVASAMIIEKTGFEAVSLQSFQCAVRDGVPDNGLGSPHELLDLIRKVSRAVSIPIIVDFEHGFGDAYNAVYWLQEFEKAGAAAVHLDDYDYLYHCPFIPPYLPTLRSDNDMVAQIEAMAAERLHQDTVIIARSGAAACRGFSDQPQRIAETNRRSKRYRDAGADVIFAHVVNKDHLLSLKDAVDAPLLLQQVILTSAPDQPGPGAVPYKIGLTDISVDELHRLGVSIVTDPLTLQGVALKGVFEAATKQRKHRTVSVVRNEALSLRELEEHFMDVENVKRLLDH